MKIFSTIEEYLVELKTYGIQIEEILDTRKDTGFCINGNEPHYGIMGKTDRDTKRISYFNIITVPNRIGFGCIAIFPRNPNLTDISSRERGQEAFSDMMQLFLDDNDDREAWKKS